MSFPWSTVITGVIAFAGIGYGAHLSGKRETLNWTRDQRLKAYVELLTAIDKCYAAFKELAEIMKELGYPIDVRDNPKVRNTIDNWNKWFLLLTLFRPRRPSKKNGKACLEGRLKAKNQYGRLYALTWIVLTLSDRGYLTRCGRCVVGFDVSNR